MKLVELIRVPGVGVADVEEALTPHFFGVFVEERKEPFFTHHVRCIDREGRTRLRFNPCSIGLRFEAALYMKNFRDQ